MTFDWFFGDIWFCLCAWLSNPWPLPHAFTFYDSLLKLKHFELVCWLVWLWCIFGCLVLLLWSCWVEFLRHLLNWYHFWLGAIVSSFHHSCFVVTCFLSHLCTVYLTLLLLWFFCLVQLLIAPHLVILTCLLSFCEGSHDSWRDSLLGIPLYLWDTIWRFIRIALLTCFLWWC